MKSVALGALIIFSSLYCQAQLNYGKTDFKTLFNAHRFSQAKQLPWPAIYWPYNGQGAGAGIDHIPDGEQMSPAQKYDLFFQTGGAAAAWEEQHHNCDNVSADNLSSCKAWYGHCNGWTGAALLNAEPDYDKPITVKNSKGVAVTFNYMDIKALLTEVWLDALVSYEGTGTAQYAQDWIFDPNDPTSKLPAANNPKLTNFEAYWDVTPKAFFLALANYIGEQKVGLAIDRFTGSEVWNQPVIGYRNLPISKDDIQQPIIGGVGGKKKIYPVRLGTKIYWANDSVTYTYKQTTSKSWDVSSPTFSTDHVPVDGTDQDKVDDNAILSRYLSYTLFFDAPVTVNADGTKILTAGRIVGDGVWTHADISQRDRWYPVDAEYSQNHPDFIWRPDHLIQSGGMFHNPAVEAAKVYKYILNKPIPGGP